MNKRPDKPTKFALPMEYLKEHLRWSRAYASAIKPGGSKKNVFYSRYTNGYTREISFTQIMGKILKNNIHFSSDTRSVHPHNILDQITEV